MRNVWFLFTIAAITAIYSTGAFIPKNSGMAETVDGLTVLNDAEMAQRVGGPWTNERASAPKGSYADCNSVSNCPDNAYTRTHARYRCIPCNDYAYEFESVVVPKVTTSWCDNFGLEGIECRYKQKTTAWHYSCVSVIGICW